MAKMNEIFGSMVFNDQVMRQRLPLNAYEAVQDAIRFGKWLTPEAAQIVAEAMKQWAVEKQATHFSHWYQPMTGITAEKHDS